MGRLRFASTFVIVGLAISLSGCGPTAEGLATPALPTAQPTGVLLPTTDPGPSTSYDPGSSGGATSIPLSTSSPLSGALWQPLTEFPASGAFEVTSVTAVGDGFTAMGFQAMPGEGFFGRRQGVIWHSPDGRSWQAVVDPAFQFVTLEEILRVGTTTFVLGTLETCGLSFDDECVEPPEAGWGLWRSVDASAWERLSLPASIQTGSVDGAVEVNGALVAFGLSGDDGRPVVWTSADGVTWGQTADLAGMDPVTSMAAGPSGLVAFGNPFSSDVGDLELLAATSTDGVHFVRVAAPALAATTIQSIAAGRSGLVAVGDGEDLELNFTGVALHSADGSSWTQANVVDGSFAESALTDVHSFPTGYVAVGIRPVPDDFGIATGASWFSADGLSYRSLAPVADRFSQLTASAAGTTGIVCFTVTEEEPDEETVISTIAGWFAPIEALPTQ